ncbi:MAG TPA: HAD-IA family hydrolase [Chloroflexota bacterium]
MAVKYILFDLDGTLVDTTNLILSTYRESVSKMVDSPPTDEEILKGFGTPLTSQLHRLFPTLRDRQDEIIELWKETQEKLHDTLIKPFPETAEVLAELRRLGHPMGVVTSKERVQAERDMKLYGLTSLIDVVVCWDDTSNHKPHPEPILKGMELLAARPQDTLYVGDSLHDMKAGREAGTRVAAAMWGPFAKDALLAFKPDYLLNSIRDLLMVAG